LIKTYKYTILLLLLTAGLFVQAQKPNDWSRGLNEYIDFSNESIHGMLIAHRLFENYNQDLNKYVDLPGHQLNFYNNSDLPADIFIDPKNWFYEVSPQRLFEDAEKNKYGLSAEDFSSLQKTANEIRQTTLVANQLRLSVGDSINNLNLNDQEALYSVYEMLEEAVDAFDLLQARVIILNDQVNRIASRESKQEDQIKFNKLTPILKELYVSSGTLVQSVKKENKQEVANQVSILRKALNRFEAYSLSAEGGFASSVYIMARNKIIKNMRSLISNASSYLNNDPIPTEYELYGNTYFFYNTRMVNKLNRYGNGLAPAINEIIDILGLNMAHKLETPHYLTIIYPEKVEKQIPVIKSDIVEIAETPVTLENRTIVMSDKKHQILVDDPSPTLEIFDHLKQDGDIISLYFNGDWIFENLSLERKPRKFILKLNEKGKNYLILHAINEGSVPPNTIGINYVHKGRRKRYIMQSNLRTSQMVEIKLDK